MYSQDSKDKALGMLRQTSGPATPANLVVCQLRLPYLLPSSRSSFVRCSFAM